MTKQMEIQELINLIEVLGKIKQEDGFDKPTTDAAKSLLKNILINCNKRWFKKYD